MDSPMAKSSPGPVLWRQLPGTCGHDSGVICRQPDYLPTGLGISHHLRTLYPGRDQALRTTGCASWHADQGCVKSGLYFTMWPRKHTCSCSRWPASTPSSASRGELGSTIALQAFSSSTLPGRALSQEIRAFIVSGRASGFLLFLLSALSSELNVRGWQRETKRQGTGTH